MIGKRKLLQSVETEKADTRSHFPVIRTNQELTPPTV
jgi:hypothetical protein